MKKIFFITALAVVILNGYLYFKSTEKKEESEKKPEIAEVPQKKTGKIGGEMQKRDEIHSKYKWNLSNIYSSWEKWEEDVKKMKLLMEEIPKYQGQISKNPETFIELLNKDEELSRLTDKVYLYPYLLKDLNSKDSTAQEKLQEIEAIYTEFKVSTAWINPEILTIPKETMEEWITNNKESLEKHKFNIMELYRLQEHVLDEKSERVLSYFTQFNGAVNDVYSELTTSDIKWNKIKLIDEKGSESLEETVVTNGTYSKIVSTDKNQENRKRAFEALYNAYNVNKNTYAAIYRGIIQRDVAGSRAKNFNSTLEMALEPDNIARSVYENLIQSARENSEPLKRYVEIRKKQLNLEKYHYYDNSVNIGEYKREFPYDEAKVLVLDSVKPLGDEYFRKLEKALGEGWLDVYETENKTSGAYSINIYDVHPYMLLNYNDTMDSVFTLAHELGHTLHSIYSNENQPYSTSNYTIFVAEVASTFNERLLLDNMLKNTKDPEERIALIEKSIENIIGTYYIQGMFADYEYQVHKLAEEGKPITAEILDGIMENLFKTYFGDSMVMDELQKIIWSRIPHFYNSPYYVYQYATSFAASALLYDNITNEKYSKEERDAARDRYLNLLKSGGNDYPMIQLKNAGADLSNIESFKAISSELNSLLDILEKELKNL